MVAEDKREKAQAETGGDEEVEEVEDNNKESKPPSRFGKLFLKLKTKVKIIDQHTMEPNFKRNLETMENYAECINQLYTGYCSLLQSNAELYKKHQVHDVNLENNVHNHLAKYLCVLRDIDVVDWQVKGEKRKHCSFFNKDEKETLDGCADVMRQLAKLEKDYRDMALKYTKDTMEFLNAFRDEFVTEKAKLEQNLLIITDLLPKIKKAKTNEELAEFGPKYEEAVNNFNRSSIDLTDFFIYNYPKFNYQHQRDLIKFHMARAKYHEEAEALIDAWLTKEDANKINSPEQIVPTTPPVETEKVEKPKSVRGFVLRKSGSADKTKKPLSVPKRKARSTDKKPPDSPAVKKSSEAPSGFEKKEQGSKRMSVMFANAKRTAKEAEKTAKTKSADP